MSLFKKKNDNVETGENMTESLSTESLSTESASTESLSKALGSLGDMSVEIDENTEQLEEAEGLNEEPTEIEEDAKDKKKKARQPRQRASFLSLREDSMTQEERISAYIDTVIDYFTQVDPIKLNMLERGKLRKEHVVTEVETYIAKLTDDEEERRAVYNGFESFVWKYDILDPLIADDSISDIKVYDWNHIRIKRLGKRCGTTVKFRDEKHFLKFIEHVAIKNKVSISDQNAAQNFTDKNSSPDAILRFNVTTGFINSSAKPVLHVRKIPKHKLTEEQLIELGFFDKKTADYLKRRITEGGGFLFAGKGGSGKTTAMNWLIDYVPHSMSGLVIQENEELFSSHPDMAFEHTVQNRGEGKIEYSLGDLARNGLLSDIDVFIIGEIKGAEALQLLNAVYTGAKGWASVHGASSTEAMKKLVDYIKYNSDYTQEEALKMLVHLDTIVFMDNFKVQEISEVVAFDEDKKDFEYKRIL